jgi:hypothetical protein
MALVSSAQAHHSIAALYDARREVTLEATVVEFRFVNPHPLIVVDVETVAGDVYSDDTEGSGRWTLEMDNRWELAELGFASDTLVPGDRIIVTGSLSRERAKALYVRRLEHSAAAFSYEHHP